MIGSDFTPFAATLSETLAASRAAPFYRQRIPQRHEWTLESFRALPLTTKVDLRANYPFGLLAVPRTRVASYHESSGSSGEPTASLFSAADWDDITSRFLRNAVELSPNDAVLIKTPYSLATTAHQMHQAARMAQAMVIPADNRSANMSYPKVLRLLKDIPATVTWSLPTEVLLWAATAKLLNLDPATSFPALRALLVAGEPLSRAKKMRLQEIWGGKRIYQDYGSTETGSLAGECAYGSLHLWSDRLYCEVLDLKTGEASTYGRGALVVTTLYREAMPLVRYLLGDDVMIHRERCACGANFPTVEIFGRLSTTPQTWRPQFLDIEDTVYSLPSAFGVWFWRAQWQKQQLNIEIEAAAEHAAAAVASLQALLADRLSLTARVTSIPAGTLVPPALLTHDQGFMKPRYLFEADETWDKSLQYMNAH